MRRPSWHPFLRSSAPKVTAIVAATLLAGCATGRRADSPSEVAGAEGSTLTEGTGSTRIPEESDFVLAASIFPSGAGSDTGGDPDSDAGTSIENRESLVTGDDLADAGSTDARGVAVDLTASHEAAPPSLGDLADFLERLAGSADDPVPYQMAAAILPLIAADPSLQSGLAPFTPATTQLSADEAAMCEALATFAVAVRGRLDAGEPPREAMLAELAALVDELRQEPMLRIGSAEICSAIRGYGDIEPLPHRMKARADQEVLVYVPLEGLDWIENRATARHGWRIRHRIELHQVSDGLVIDPGSWTDLSHDLPEPTRDTYFWVRYTVPGSDLAAGRFALKVRIEEPSTGRQVERTIELELLPERLLARE